MPNQDEATLELMLSDPELRGFAVQMLNEALRQMRYDLRYGTPAQKAAIYRNVMTTILRQSMNRTDENSLDELRAQLDAMRDEMRNAAPTPVERQVIRADRDSPPIRKPPPPIPPRTHAKSSFSTRDI